MSEHILTYWVDVCGFSSADNVGTIFRPVASPLCTYPTPIQQLALSNSTFGWSFKLNERTLSDLITGANLAVRTYGSLHLMQLRPSSGNGVSAQEAASFSRADFADEKVVDVKHSSTLMFTVGHEGSVFECSVGNGTKLV